MLGLISGLCAGYLVQAGREPTGLPPLSQPRLEQAAGEAPGPLPAARDREVRTDGDLRRLLLEKPDGAGGAGFAVGGSGWLDLTGLAQSYDEPATAYNWLLDEEFRRAAMVGWREGGTRTVEIRLLQFRQEEVLGARDEAQDGSYQNYWADVGVWAIPGTGDGKVYIHRKPRDRGGARLYQAEAHAWRGDISLQIWMNDTEPIPKKAIVDLAKRQMERL
ncbi:hypothetical protein ACH4JS_05115 [Streptomyces sp. NPDC017638]|uniref:hypothetical protein n=1 Tax=Streptomyces sp. NPDC017638 TaxID=3365004 RepID=UPI0037AE1A1C